MAIPFYAKRVKVEELAKINKKGTEETGRKVRYDFFNEICKKENANKIAIAHNQNDNAETMILNLVRGCGMQGLEGIQPSEYGKYIRPLIYVSRKEIEQYCEKNQLHPRIDSTNKENIYKRNIIRNIIMPELRKLNPNIEESLSRTSILAKENNEFVEQYAKKEYESIESKKNSNEVEIDLKKFNQENISIKQIIIRTAIEKLTGTTRNISKSYIDNIISMANNNIGGKHIEFNKIQVGVTKGKIIFAKKEQ
jgi:tRNA(Ile)-lysidine synthase